MKANIQSQSKRSKWILSITFALVLTNFLGFVFGSLYLGGDAINVYTQAGHYFLCAHSNCTEVTQSLWKYSCWHAISTILSFVLIFLEVLVFMATGHIVLNFQKQT